MRLLLLALAVAALGTPANARVTKHLKPVVGWNTWCTQNKCTVDWCNEAEVLDVATYMKSNGFQQFYDYILLDDCWGVRNNHTGEIEGDPLRFPSGMASLVSKLHDMGWMFGLYSDVGPNGCHHPFTGSWPYYARDAATFADWKIDLLKLDGCDPPPGHDLEDLSCNMSQTLEAVDDSIWLNFHCWHTDTCATCGNSFRVGPDHHDEWGSTSGIIELLKTRQPFWGQPPSRGWPDPDFVFTGGQGCGLHSEPGVRCPGQSDDEYISEFSIWALAGGQIVMASDPRNMTDFMRKVLLNEEVFAVFLDQPSLVDVQFLGNASSLPARRRSRFSASCAVDHQISKAPCVEGKTFACNSDGTMWVADGCRASFTCNGVEGVDCESNDSKNVTCKCVAPPPQVWARPLSDGSSAALVLHNPNDSAQDITVDFAAVPKRSWGASTQLQVRDLWAKASNGTATGSFTARGVPSHGAAFIKLSP